ncbi:MAG: hypothetical protein ABIH63_00545 [archaeon]
MPKPKEYRTQTFKLGQFKRLSLKPSNELEEEVMILYSGKPNKEVFDITFIVQGSTFDHNGEDCGLLSIPIHYPINSKRIGIPYTMRSTVQFDVVKVSLDEIVLKPLAKVKHYEANPFGLDFRTV